MNHEDSAIAHLNEPKEAEETAAHIREHFGGIALVVQGDLRDPATIDPLIDSAYKDWVQ